MARDRSDNGQTKGMFSSEVERLDAGSVPREYLTLLYGLLKPAETPVRNAVADHLCDGILQSTAAEKYGVKQGSISRQVSRLQIINEKVCELAKYHR